MFALFHYFFHSCLRAKNQFVFERCSCSSSSRPSSIMQFKLHSKNIAIKIIMYIWLIVFWNRALYAQFFDVNLLGEMQWNSIERKVCICRIQLIPIDWLNRECPTENGLSNNWCVSEVVEEKCSVLNWKKRTNCSHSDWRTIRSIVKKVAVLSPYKQLESNDNRRRRENEQY